MFFSDLMISQPEKNPNKLAAWGLYAYADALANQVSAKDIFSCTDPVLMAYRDDMQKKFGMEILTPEEAEEKERQEVFCRRIIDVSADIKRVIDFATKKQKWEDKYNSNKELGRRSLTP